MKGKNAHNGVSAWGDFFLFLLTLHFVYETNVNKWVWYGIMFLRIVMLTLRAGQFIFTNCLGGVTGGAKLNGWGKLP